MVKARARSFFYILLTIQQRGQNSDSMFDLIVGKNTQTAWGKVYEPMSRRVTNDVLRDRQSLRFALQLNTADETSPSNIHTPIAFRRILPRVDNHMPVSATNQSGSASSSSGSSRSRDPLSSSSSSCCPSSFSLRIGISAAS